MSARKVLIGGGSGFIGTELTKILSTCGYDVVIVSRMPGLRRITWHELDSNGLPDNTKAVVNLAGQNVLDPSRRWTPGFKQNVYNSRINTTLNMVRVIEKAEQKPDSFITVSGVSLYPCDQEAHCENDSGKNYDFMSKLCIDWEKASRLPPEIDCRQVNIRSGVVIGKGGGMIKSLYFPFWLGLGGPMGKGSQILPWIHLTDLCNLIAFAIKNQNVQGVLNGVAPDIITNQEFTKAFASAIRRPALIPVPEQIVNIIFGKERAVLLTEGPKVEPKRVLEYGFEYKYPTVKKACLEVVGR